MKFVSIRQLTSFLALFVVTASVLADSEKAPYAKINTVEHGSCYFKQIPEKRVTDEYGESNVERIAHGAAYQVEGHGADSQLWEVSGWYAFSVFLSNDCQYLVRMGNWARGLQPSGEDLAVAFYKNGALLKRYSTEDLINDKSGVSRSVSHYRWQSDDTQYPKLDENAGTFHIMTIEGVHFRFNIKDGELVDNQ